MLDPSYNLKSDVIPGCGSDGSLVHCRPSHPRCYHRVNTCVYDTWLIDEAHNISIQTSCRDGSHLRRYCGNSLKRPFHVKIRSTLRVWLLKRTMWLKNHTLNTILPKQYDIISAIAKWQNGFFGFFTMKNGSHDMCKTLVGLFLLILFIFLFSTCR